MRIATPEDLLPLLRFAADPAGQTASGAVVFTAQEIHQIVGEGRVGGAGGKEDEARRIKRPARREAGEKEGWWELAAGPYWVLFHERIRIPRGGLLLLAPHPEITANGLSHPALFAREGEEPVGVLLLVNTRGVKIREGAPVSRGVLLLP